MLELDLGALEAQPVDDQHVLAVAVADLEERIDDLARQQAE